MGENELSRDGEYLEQYRPERFLDCFRLWAQGRTARSVQYLKDIDVLCGEDGENELVPFGSAYFPTETLKARVNRFLPPGSFFPWLRLEKSEPFGAIPPQWKSLLNKVGSGTPSSDLDFALDMLKYFADAMMFTDTMSTSDKARVFELYEHISIEHRGAKSGTISHADATTRIR